MDSWTNQIGIRFEKDEKGVVSLVKAPEDIKEYTIPEYVSIIG